MNGVSCSPQHAIDMVWDGGVSTTGVADGTVVTNQNVDRLLPEQLLLLAAQRSVLDTLLTAARELDVQLLGYVSSAHYEPSPDGRIASKITLRPCIVVASALDAGRAERALQSAVARSVVGSLLGDRLQLHSDIQLESVA